MEQGIDWNQFFTEEAPYGSIQQVDYLDTDSDGLTEAFVFFEGTWGGTASGAFWTLNVFEFDDECSPQPRGAKSGGPFASVSVGEAGTYRL